ncbi:MAG: class I SAM-dependent methyltransferase [Armatimonadetes bacterium]|nr:class I SAM-dependent methyltransferase [Armatimonadota bacterium]
MSVCPLCGKNAEAVLYSVDSETAARALFGESDDRRVLEARASIEALWAGQSCYYLQCRHCSFSFADPFVAAPPSLYAALYRSSTPYSQWKWEFQRTIDALRTLVDVSELQGFRLLDIGAGDGAFVSGVRDRIPECQSPICTEYSEYGRNAIERRGIACVKGGLDDSALDDYQRSFDVISLFQVLEHLNDLDAVFHRLSFLARDRAHMFVAVPNHAQRSYFDRSGFHEDMPPIHIGRWTRQCLQLIAGRHGWQVREDEIEPQSLLSKLRRYAYQFYRSSPSIKAMGKVRQRHLRRVLRGSLIVLFLLRSIPAVAGLSRRSLGSVYWAHLSKE